MKDVVITVHGIRTDGAWQKCIAAPLAARGMVAVPHHYGRFGLARFVMPWARARRVEAFHQFYEQVVHDARYELDIADATRRPSIIAHSLGSFIVGMCLAKYEDVKINRLILCGSILPRDFDWSLLFARDQVAAVRNDRGLRDVWVRLAPLVVRGAGASGAAGFDYFGSLLTEQVGEHLEHSDYFASNQIESRWIPFLGEPPSQYRVLQSRDVADSRQLLDQAHAIDTLSYQDSEGYTEAELPRGLSTGWLGINNDLYAFLMDRRSGEMAGYLNAMPVSRELADAILAGEVIDNEVSPDDVVPYLQSEKPRAVYLMSIAVSPKSRGSTGLYSEPMERLVNALMSKLCYYALQHRFAVSELIAVGWTPKGRRLCKMFGMVERPDVKDRFGNPIYHARMADLAAAGRRIHPGLKKLTVLYRRLGLV